MKTISPPAVDALADARRTRLILVARAQPATLREAARTQEELAAIGLTQQYLVINGIFPPHETHRDPLATAIFRREQAALAAIPGSLEVGIEILGLDHQQQRGLGGGAAGRRAALPLGINARSGDNLRFNCFLLCGLCKSPDIYRQG